MKKSLLFVCMALLLSELSFSQGSTGCWREVSAGTNFSLGIKSDGTLWGWGQNGNLLGLGYFSVSENLPIQIGTANDWMTVSAGALHSLAIKTNGTLWAWGSGIFGQLGNGAFNSATFNVTQVGTGTNWQSCSSGNKFSLAIQNNGTLWSWGLNNTGQLGNNSVIDLNVPTQVGTATDWLRVDAGDQHSLGVKTTGDLWAWGNNSFGQLGDASFTTSLVPIQIGTLNNWSLVSAGLDHSMILDATGILYTFGNNVDGQLADGSNTLSNVPIPISFNADGSVSLFIAISAGNSFSLVIKNDNTLRSSGFNTSGQLGLANNSSVNFFNQVGTSNTWLAISAGNLHSLALENSLDLWSTGRNSEGQLGIGNFVPSNTLQQIACPSLGINPTLQENFKLNYYPNPAKDFIQLEYTIATPTNLSLELFNTQGQRIKEQKLDSTGGNHLEVLNISEIPAGFYFIKLENDQSFYRVGTLIKN